MKQYRSALESSPVKDFLFSCQTLDCCVSRNQQGIYKCNHKSHGSCANVDIKVDEKPWKSNIRSTGIVQWRYYVTNHRLQYRPFSAAVFLLIGDKIVTSGTPYFVKTLIKLLEWIVLRLRRQSGTMKYTPTTNGNHSPANPFVSFCNNIKEHVRHLNYAVMTIPFCSCGKR